MTLKNATQNPDADATGRQTTPADVDNAEDGISQQTPPANDADATGQQTTPADVDNAEDGAESGVKDKHGHPGISEGKYKRDMEAKDAKIAELQAKVDEAAETKAGRKELMDEITALKAEQEEERIAHKLEMAGCKSVKAAKALLEDCDNDVAKLKAEHPYLFEKEKQTGSTGMKPEGAPDATSEQRLKEARAVAGIRTKE